MYGGRLSNDECPTCTNFYDDYGSSFTECNNISYKKFKLFLLSILWRASISSRPLFKNISLGPHEEIIRKMVFEKNPGEVSDYPIMFLSYLNDKSMYKDMILTPSEVKAESGHRVKVFIIGGMFYLFYINAKGKKLPEQVLNETIKQSNQMRICHVPKGNAWDLIHKYCGINMSNSKFKG
jgi:hypothetical protein